MHQTVEGSQVGANDYTFRSGPDVIRGRDIPGVFDAILSGHIHRGQVLTHDLSHSPLAAPVIYPGAVERTSFAERREDKGYVILSIGPRRGGKEPSRDISFVPLPARPMVSLVLEPAKLGSESLTDHLRRRLSALDADSVVRVRLSGPGSDTARKSLSAAQLRALAPPSMNVSLAIERSRRMRE
jgi:DNA repair exonuclease SbcCD nuclease subunit